MYVQKALRSLSSRHELRSPQRMKKQGVGQVGNLSSIPIFKSGVRGELSLVLNQKHIRHLDGADQQVPETRDEGEVEENG